MTPAAREARARRHVVPDVVGLSERDAQIMLQNVGFPPGEVEFVESYAPERTIVATDPGAGQMISGTTTVRLRVSRDSLSRFLPTVYHGGERGTESDFLRRFLWVLTHLHDSVNDRVDGIASLFKPFESDPEFLPWLASWLALTLDTEWPDEKKRRFIRRAAELYTIRGTSRALTEILEVFTGVRPEILENEWPYKGFRIGVSSLVGIDTIMLPPMNLAYCFIVRIPLCADTIDEATLVKIHQIIQHEKPAHTTYYLAFDEGESGVQQRVFDASDVEENPTDDASPEAPGEQE